ARAPQQTLADQSLHRLRLGQGRLARLLSVYSRSVLSSLLSEQRQTAVDANHLSVDESCGWRTEKGHDVRLIPGRAVPYERAVLHEQLGIDGPGVLESGRRRRAGTDAVDANIVRACLHG